MFDELKPPLNFVLDDLYEENNNDVAFVLLSGDRFGASSAVLGHHSAMIKERYIQEGILEIEADEFSYDTVK